jgi:hypothetical protein
MGDGVDALILSSTSSRWQKVARIIALVSDRAADGTSCETIARRIRVLVAEGQLQVKGDPSRWRFSEVWKAK